MAVSAVVDLTAKRLVSLSVIEVTLAENSLHLRTTNLMDGKTAERDVIPQKGIAGIARIAKGGGVIPLADDPGDESGDCHTNEIGSEHEGWYWQVCLNCTSDGLPCYMVTGMFIRHHMVTICCYPGSGTCASSYWSWREFWYYGCP